MDAGDILRDAGPYTAPLCAAMAVAIKWLVADRNRLLKALSAALERERALSDKRAEEGMESLRIMAESDKTLRETLSEHDKYLDRLIERWDRWLSSK